jgi:hypothetical protein
MNRTSWCPPGADVTVSFRAKRAVLGASRDSAVASEDVGAKV